MTITVATADITDNPLQHRPGIMRLNYHVADDQGNSYTYKKVDAPIKKRDGTLFDPDAFVTNELAPHWERGIKEQIIRAEEEAKAASRLATKEQAVENEKQAIDDAIDTRMESSRG